MASAAAAAPPVPAAPPEAGCIICLDRGDEPLHRNCACRGPTAGFAHMSCLVRYVSSAATNKKLGYDCGTCKQRYFGATQLGLARARWEQAAAGLWQPVGMGARGYSLKQPVDVPQSTF